MINEDPNNRPTVEQTLAHPFFWTDERTLVGSPPWLFSARAPVPSQSPLPILFCSRSAPPLDFSGRCLLPSRRRSALLALKPV
ncbi:hypothetical protein G5714_007581 [Onychostoma macrolepis]|uniref:Uncharacterized protein n=1 Tax=Onychostoma macrolepis TaxID=369639 RepID=A0A7J6CTG4_9TELE|nr:hypothetical protein G5714_007581 [Onychostoma macrolepis]